MTPDNHRAIREKRKTITRRLDHLKEFNKAPNLWKWIGHDQAGRFSFRFEPSGDVYNYFPRYRVRETVYVKEVWAIEPDDRNKLPIPENEVVKVRYIDGEMEKRWGDIIVNNNNVWLNSVAKAYTTGKWQSPMFLPQKAARTFIEITDVRPERLKDITEGDCILEGIEPFKPDLVHLDLLPIQKFQRLWDSINKAYPFDGNYWVWRICFHLEELE